MSASRGRIAEVGDIGECIARRLKAECGGIGECLSRNGVPRWEAGIHQCLSRGRSAEMGEWH